MGGRDVRTVVVVGAGTMGHGIAQVAAMAGAAVTLIDRDEVLAARALERIRQNLDAGVERGKVTPDLRTATLERTRVHTDLSAAAADADLTIEAVPERLDLKRSVFATLEAAAPPDAILATNTSSLSITEIQAELVRPERVVGLHFFNPVHIMALVEVVRGDLTSDGVIDAAVAFVRALGKEPIVVTDSPGFASSRLGIALGLEAMRMVEEGVASPADIDTAMTLGYRHPMGPLRLTDLVGLDVRLDIAEYLHARLGGERFRPPNILREKVARGELGRKTGLGFFRWDDTR
jgi:3-hydroxybutyryl-CoA dehydrogenase